MATRSYTDVAPTADTIALNAFIYGFSGHSLVTPHHTLRQLWWTERKIQSKVTRAFVVSKLKGVERSFLDKPLAFGEGLTDDTYMEWILERAKRLFLILSEIGVPDQIFGCIDDSWDDDDLPLSLDAVPHLDLSYDHDPALNKKFYDTQFIYLLRELKPNSHIDYGPQEHIPLEFLESRPPAVALQVWDRVFFPGRPDEVYMRRKFTLKDKETGHNYKDGYLNDTRKAQRLKHEHVASVWASYTTSEGAGYVLSDFVGEHTLGSFIDHRKPPQFAYLSNEERPVLLWEWMHCLSDALAFLHSRGEAHTAIRPSNIIIDRSNRIAFSDVGSIKTLQRGKRTDKKEAYDYAAPGTELSKSCNRPNPSSPPLSSAAALSRLRKFSSSGSTSSGSSTSNDSLRSSSFSHAIPLSPPATPPLGGRTPSFTSLRNASFSNFSARNFSRHLRSEPCPYPVVPLAQRSPILAHFPSTACSTSSQNNHFDLIPATPAQCDIFSLACVYLDILTFMLQGKRTEFIKFRNTVPQTAKPVSRSIVPTPPAHSHNNKPDSSFHANPTKIFTWLDILDAEADKRTEAVYRGIPAALALLRKMLSPNPVLRPTAIEARDSLSNILIHQCQISNLCCTDRIWEEEKLEVRLSDVGVAVTADHKSEVAVKRDSSLESDETVLSEVVKTEDIVYPPPLHVEKERPDTPRDAPVSNRVVEEGEEPATPRTVNVNGNGNGNGNETVKNNARRLSTASSKFSAGFRKAFFSRQHESSRVKIRGGL